MFSSKHPYLDVKKQFSREFLRAVQEYFIRSWKISNQGYVLSTLRKQNRKTVECFFGRLNEEAEIFRLEDEEISLIRYIIISNIIEFDTKKEMLRETGHIQKKT